MNKWQALEVEWYRANGKYPERIAVDGEGEPYVIGDSGWNTHHPAKTERVEDEMRRHVVRAGLIGGDGDGR